MRHELTLVSSINDLWLVRLIYIGDVVPLSWGVFTLVCFTRLWYLIWYIYIYIYRRYHTITYIYTTALVLTKPSSDDDFRGRNIITTSPERPSSISQRHQTLSDSCHSIGLPDPRWYSQSVILDLFHVFPLTWWRKSKISQENGGWVGNKTSASPASDTVSEMAG